MNNKRMSKYTKLIVKKKPLITPSIEHAQNFPIYPVLYLEMLENKEKIKPSVVNKEYTYGGFTINQTNKNIEESKEYSEEYDNNSDISDSYDYNEVEGKELKSESNFKRISDDKHSSDNKENKEKSLDVYNKNNSIKENKKSLEEFLLFDEEEKENKKDNEYNKKEKVEKVEKSIPNKTETSVNNKTTNLNVNSGQEIKNKIPVQKPYIYNLNRLNGASTNQVDEEEMKKRRDLLFRFSILKKSYKDAHIPDYNEYTDSKELQKSYDNLVRRLHLDVTVEYYKKYLTGGFMIMEWGLGMLNFDMKGFTQEQMLNMNSYERILIELGEKSYLQQQTQWSPELRLIFILLMNTGMFIVGKMITQRSGADLSGVLNSFMNSNQQQASNPQVKKKMKGPDMSIINNMS